MTVGLSRKGFDIDLLEGQARETAFVNALGDCSVEHKWDDMAAKTGNVFIEIEQKGHPTFERRPSGLQVTTAKWWAHQYMDDRWLVLRTSVLRELVSQSMSDGDRVRWGGDNGDYLGVLVPLASFLPR